MKNAMLFKKSFIILIMSVIISFGVIPAEASSKTVLNVPFDRHDEWYSYVGGTDGSYTYGYLNSPSTYLDFTFDGSTATVFPTKNSITQKAYWAGGCMGWIHMYYKYKDGLELDLDQLIWEYDITAEERWDVSFVFKSLDGGTKAVSLSTILKGMDSSYQQIGTHKGSFSLLEAIQKYYFDSKSALGLTAGTYCVLDSIDIFYASDFQNVMNIYYRTCRLMRDPSLESQKKNQGNAWEGISSGETGSETNTSKAEFQTEDSNASIVTETETISDNQNNSDKKLPVEGIIIATGAVLILAGFGTFVLIKHNKSPVEKDNN